MNYKSKMRFYDESYLDILQRKKVNKFRENCEEILKGKSYETQFNCDQIKNEFS